jgi:2-polyprenyl-3-methyl-5-hydroxy-6-metoxy-1,4-benzoquinol methylase
MCVHSVYQNAGNPPILDLLPRRPGRVLDCGCGAGDNARLLKARGARVTGITISPAEAELARAHCEQVHIADLELGIPAVVSGPFDAVLMSHVLEHLRCPEAVLESVKRVLAPEGVVAVALPNTLVYPNRLKLLLGSFTYQSSGIMDSTHVRFYTFATGARLLEANGFHIVRRRADGAFPLWRLRAWLPASLVAKVNRIACALWPGLFGFQSVYLATTR